MVHKRADYEQVTNSTILYLDGKKHDFQDDVCSGTQSSRRLDSQIVEVVFTCKVRKVRIARRSAASPNELILAINEQFADGRRFERHLILEKQ